MSPEEFQCVKVKGKALGLMCVIFNFSECTAPKPINQQKLL